jgi:hypothetical protein
MSKKTKKTRPKPAQKKAGPEVKPETEQQASFEEKPFDFGGLPARDLKKNLGCG